MTHVNEVAYRGHVLTATALSDHDMYAAVVIVRAPSGVQRRATYLASLPALGPVRYATAYGMATIAYQQVPTSLKLIP